MIIDSHIHVGQFCDLYFTPATVHELVRQIGIDYYAVSSTTQCEENYPKILLEMEELIRLDGKKVLPVMWITPGGLAGNIAWYLESEIKWRMLKIHPSLHPGYWTEDCSHLEEVVNITKELEVPLLIHTGNDPCCEAGKFGQIIAQHPDIIFILAHSRPLANTMAIIREYGNAFSDTAFMPVEDMRTFVDAGLSHRLLWGTDMCIPKYYYPDENMVDYYHKKLSSFRKVCSKEDFFRVTYANAAKIFGPW